MKEARTAEVQGTPEQIEPIEVPFFRGRFSEAFRYATLAFSAGALALSVACAPTRAERPSGGAVSGPAIVQASEIIPTQGETPEEIIIPFPPTPEPVAGPEFTAEQQQELLGMIGVPEMKNGKEVYPPDSVIASFQSVDPKTYLPEKAWLGQGQQRDEWVTKLKEEIRPAIEAGDLEAAKESATNLRTEISRKQGSHILTRRTFDGLELDQNDNKIEDQWEEAVGKLDEVLQKLEGLVVKS